MPKQTDTEPGMVIDGEYVTCPVCITPGTYEKEPTMTDFPEITIEQFLVLPHGSIVHDGTGGRSPIYPNPYARKDSTDA